MDDYDFSEVESLFQWDDGGAGEFEQAATGGQYPDYSGMFDFGGEALSDEELGAVGNYLAQNGIDINTLMADTKPGMWDTIKDGASSIGKAWSGLGPAGQMLLGNAAAGGLSTYLQNRQRDQELASLTGMKEEEFNRALTLKRAPTNMVADVNHFQGMINSLRGKQ